VTAGDWIALSAFGFGCFGIGWVWAFLRYGSPAIDAAIAKTDLAASQKRLERETKRADRLDEEKTRLVDFLMCLEGDIALALEGRPADPPEAG
jgi:hypothetical protein